jgi:hypothetical protein
MPGEAGEPVVTMLVCFFILHARLRVHRAPGIPHALTYRGEKFHASLGRITSRECEGVSVLFGEIADASDAVLIPPTCGEGGHIAREAGDVTGGGSFGKRRNNPTRLAFGQPPQERAATT